MTHHEVCNTPNLPTECCCPNAHLPARRIPARTTLAHCSICSRRYHIDCLPLTHRPAGDILEEDVTTGWTCIECNRDQYATKGLPLDIRHYNVHWKPSMVGWPSVILTPMGPSLNLTREGTSRPSLRSSLSLSLGSPVEKVRATSLHIIQLLLR